MKKKIIIIASIIIVIIAIGIGAFIFIDKENEKKEDAVALTLKENLTVEFGSKVKVSDFIDDLKGELLEDNLIDTGNLGKITVNFNYKSIRNKNKTKSFEINVVDTTKPMIYMGGSISVNVGYDKEIKDLIFSGDNADSTPERKIIGDYDINSVGKYNLTYSIKDKSGNEETQDFVLNVVSKTSGGGNNNSPKNTILFEDAINKYKNENTKIGIDVSQWQGDIDWKKVKSAGADFAIIRLGYQKGFDKEYALDPYFVKNIEGAKNNDIDVGIYFYSYAKTIKEAEEQANFISDNLKNYDIDLPIAFDWESWSSFVNCNMSFYDINKIAKTYETTLNKKGYKASLYSSKNYLQKVWYADDFENVWLAHYTSKTDYDNKYYLWQMCNTGKIDGINGDVDIDILYLK